MIKGIKKWVWEHGKEILIDISIGVFVLGLVVTSVLLLFISTLEIPDLASFEQRRILQSTKIYDRTGEILLYDLHEDVKRTIVPFEDISYHIKNATVAIEDDTFYEHWGVRPLAIVRAALSNLRGGDLFGGQGGSTITQQVIKNSVLEQEKTITRKIKEAILAVKLEKELTKDQILYHYLNESPYGGTLYGVEEASQAFFGKAANEVSLAEAAYLAALPQAPTRYSPYGNNRELLNARKDRVLQRMLELGFINSDEYNNALKEEVEFLAQATTGIRAPHFVMFVREQLADLYGDEALAERGFKVITTLDWELQEQAEEIVARKAAENTERFNASNAGLVALNPQEGDILTMVGSRNYFDEEIDGNFNVTLAPRQPGSSIKPIVYSSAFSKGYTPETVVYDVKTQFSSVCQPTELTSQTPCYSPNNYNGKFLGPISLRNALAQSLNIPAVKVLYLTGLKDAIKLANDMGITTLDDPDRLGLTLVLGGGEVKLLEHTGAYGVLANKGMKAEQRAILRVEDLSGNVIDSFEPRSNRVLDQEVALQITDILADNNARAPLWGYNSQIYFPNRDVAAKSGSTNNLRDAWIMGYAPNLAVGVWVGNNNNEAMGGGLSGLIATPMWREFMDIALPTIEEEFFTEPKAIDQNIKPILKGITIDANDLLATASSSGEDFDIQSFTSGIHNILHFVQKSNPRGPYPQNPQSDPQYSNWEYGVQRWKEEEFLSSLQLLLQQLQQTESDSRDTDREQEEDEDIEDN